MVQFHQHIRVRLIQAIQVKLVLEDTALRIEAAVVAAVKEQTVQVQVV